MARSYTAESLKRYLGRPKDPALGAAWQAALQRTVNLPVEGNTPQETRAAMNRLRYALYEYRLILRAEGDPLYNALQRLTITTKKVNDNKFILTIGAGDSLVRSALKKAGFLTPEPGAEPDDDFFNPEEDT